MGEKRQTTANDEKALREWLSRGAAKPNQSDMVNFKEALGSISPKIRPGLVKRLEAQNIRRWEDLDKWHLSRLAGDVKSTMAASSAHTTFAVFKAFLAKFEDEISLPKDWRRILECRNELPMKTYLTSEEVERFGEAYVDSAMEQTVRDGFYVSCKTGLRHSDLLRLRPSNFQPREKGGYYLNYVSKKTHIQASIICSQSTKDKVDWLHSKGVDVSLAYYNHMVRTLAERADIDEEVTVFSAGKELSGPKYKFLSSHSARVSFCTILADLGTDILDIMRLAGHTNPAMSARYIARHDVKINEKVKEFLM